MRSLHDFIDIKKYRTIMPTTVCLFHCRNSSQYLKKLFQSASARKSNLKFCTVASTKDAQRVTLIFDVLLTGVVYDFNIVTLLSLFVN